MGGNFFWKTKSRWQSQKAQQRGESTARGVSPQPERRRGEPTAQKAQGRSGWSEESQSDVGLKTEMGQSPSHRTQMLLLP